MVQILFNRARAFLSFAVLESTEGINVNTEPRRATTAKNTVVIRKITTDRIPSKIFVIIIQRMESSVRLKIKPGILKVTPPPVKISAITPPHKN